MTWVNFSSRNVNCSSFNYDGGQCTEQLVISSNSSTVSYKLSRKNNLKMYKCVCESPPKLYFKTQSSTSFSVYLSACAFEMTNSTQSITYFSKSTIHTMHYTIIKNKKLKSVHSKIIHLKLNY